MYFIFFCQVSLGTAHTVAISDTGCTWSFGRNQYGQLGHGDTEDRYHPELIDSLELLYMGKVVAGGRHTMFLTDGAKMMVCGDGRDGQLGLGDESPSAVQTPTLLPLRFTPSDMQAGGAHSLILSDIGNVYSFGNSGRHGKLGHLSTATQLTPKRMVFLVNEVLAADARFCRTVVDALIPHDLRHDHPHPMEKDESTLADRARIVDEMVGSLVSPPPLPAEKERFFLREVDAWSKDHMDQPDDVVVSEELGAVRGGNNITKDVLEQVQDMLTETCIEDEKLSFRRMFIECDTDDSGFIDQFELKQAFDNLHISVSKKKVKRIIRDIDVDNMGTISESEFVEYMEETYLRKKQGWLARNIAKVTKPFNRWKMKLVDATPHLQPQTYQYFFKTFMIECGKAGLPRIPGNLARRMTDVESQPGLEFGELNLSSSQLTDQHCVALMRSLRRVPIIGVLDLRMNSITDEGVEEIIRTLHYSGELGLKDSYTALCLGCGEDAQYRKNVSPFARCMLCGETTYRPVYFLRKVFLEDEIDAAQIQKWSKVEFDRRAGVELIQLTDHGPPLPLDEFKKAYAKMLKRDIRAFKREAFANPFTRAMRKDMGRDLVKALAEDFDKFGAAQWGKHEMRYYTRASLEVKLLSRSARVAMVRRAKEWFSTNVPSNKDAISTSVVELFEMGMEIMDEQVWTAPDALDSCKDAVKQMSVLLYDHYLQYNDYSVCTTLGAGNAHSGLTTASGMGILAGFGEALRELFGNLILEALPEDLLKKVTKAQARENRRAEQEELDEKEEERKEERKNKFIEEAQMSYESADFLRGLGESLREQTRSRANEEEHVTRRRWAADEKRAKEEKEAEREKERRWRRGMGKEAGGGEGGGGIDWGATGRGAAWAGRGRAARLARRAGGGGGLTVCSRGVNAVDACWSLACLGNAKVCFTRRRGEGG